MKGKFSWIATTLGLCVSVWATLIFLIVDGEDWIELIPIYISMAGIGIGADYMESKGWI